MFSRLREPFGRAGLIVAVIALVAALVGGAYAASRETRHHKKAQAGLNAKQKNQVKSIAKAFQGTGPAGPQGPAGAKGDNGAQGAKGDAGAQGEKGEKGDTGTNGTPGTNGKNVALTTITTAGLEGHCEGTGGTRVEVQGEATTRKYVCNGENGEDGETGFTETLPIGATETGTYAFAGQAAELFEGALTAIRAPISFPIPLAAAPNAAHVKDVEVGGLVPSECENSTHPGTASVANPEAESGYLCIYEGFRSTGIDSFGTESPASESEPAAVSGAMVKALSGFVTSPPAAEMDVYGTWAVTG